MIKYLKPKQYYIDLYNRFTVERCRRWEKICLADDGKPMVYKEIVIDASNNESSDKKP